MKSNALSPDVADCDHGSDCDGEHYDNPEQDIRVSTPVSLIFSEPLGLVLNPYGADQAPIPAIWASPEGGTLIYGGGNRTLLYGAEGTGKSMLTLEIIRQYMGKGRVVLFDLEIENPNNPKRLFRRALELGGDDFLDYLCNPHCVTIRNQLTGGGGIMLDQTMSRLMQWLGADPWRRTDGLVIIDNLSRGGCQGTQETVREFLNMHSEPWKKAGISQILVDHPPTTRPGRTSAPIGSAYKRFVVDAIIEVSNPKPLNRHDKDQFLQWTVTKDRDGELSNADIQWLPTDEGNHLQIIPSTADPTPATVTDAQLQEAILKIVTANPGLSKTLVGNILTEQGTKAGKQRKLKAIQHLIDNDQLTGTKDGKSIKLNPSEPVPEPESSRT